MSHLSQYLHDAKIEELASDLKRDGYDVAVEPGGQDEGFDVIARKGQMTVAYEVKVRSDLKGAEESVRRLRDKAIERGYDFRLVIVTPPHRVDVEIESFEESLFGYLADQIPNKLEALAGRVVLDDVADIELVSVRVDRGDVHLKGSGVVTVELEYGGGKSRYGYTTSDTFPLAFDVTLNRDLQVVRGDFEVDTSSFYR